MHRVIEVVGGQRLALRSKVDGSQTQQFIFDQVTKTVTSVSNREKSFDIKNGGKNKHL